MYHPKPMSIQSPSYNLCVKLVSCSNQGLNIAFNALYLKQNQPLIRLTNDRYHLKESDLAVLRMWSEVLNGTVGK